jgi:hypothetical protein
MGQGLMGPGQRPGLMPGGPGGPPMQLPPGMKMPNPDDCPDLECTICGCPDFVRISRVKAIAILMLPPAGGHFEMNNLFCASCQVQLDIDRAKRWAFLTPEKRIEARKQHHDALIEKGKKDGVIDKDGKAVQK